MTPRIFLGMKSLFRAIEYKYLRKCYSKCREKNQILRKGPLYDELCYIE